MTEFTRNGICKTLFKSPYKLQVLYGDKEITFYFSSSYNVERFKSKLESNRNYYNSSLSKRFKFEVTNNVVADIKLYCVIEQRGFFISSNGVIFDCLENLILNGDNLTNKS